MAIVIEDAPFGIICESGNGRLQSVTNADKTGEEEEDEQLRRRRRRRKERWKIHKVHRLPPPSFLPSSLACSASVTQPVLCAVMTAAATAMPMDPSQSQRERHKREREEKERDRRGMPELDRMAKRPANRSLPLDWTIDCRMNEYSPTFVLKNTAKEDEGERDRGRCSASVRVR